jgi:cytochrome b
MPRTVRVWDLPTRIFHWALVACICGSVVTSQIGGNAMPWHFRFGYSIASLLLFRIVWGFVGGRWSRFASFIYSPATVVRYLRGSREPEHTVGHTPLGAGSVFAMLAILVAQVGTGVLSDDEIAAAGPMTRFVSGATVDLATHYHKGIGKYVLLGLVALHITAIVFYLLKRENLLQPMMGGDKSTEAKVQGSRDDSRSRTTAAIVFALCAGLVAVLVRIAG